MAEPARQTCLTRGPLGTAGKPARERELVPTPQFMRLSQARGHL
jgi:hypothetical protein